MFSTEGGNQKNIVRLVRANDGISRTEISKLVKLSLPSVVKHIDFLIDNGIIYEDGFNDSSGGRRPIVLKYNYQRCIVLLIFAHKNVINIEASYLDGTTLYSEQKQLSEIKISKEEVIDLINESILKVYDMFHQLDLVTVSIDAVVEDDVIYKSKVYEELNQLKLAEEVFKRNHVNLIVKQDLDCRLIGNILKKKDMSEDLVYLDFSETELRMKSFVNGDMLKGQKTQVFQIGDLRVDRKVTVNESLFYKKTSYIGEFETKGNNELMENQDWNNLVQKVNSNQESKQNVYNYISSVFEVVVESILFTLNPKRIYLGGENPLLAPDFIETINQSVNKVMQEDINIVESGSTYELEKSGMLAYSIEHLENVIL